MRRSTLARWLVVGALAALGLFGGASMAYAQTEGTNDSAGASAESGGAAGSNEAGSVQSGPSAQQFDGDVSAAIVHDGDNEANVQQSGTARSGDSVAGSQVTGVVSDGDVVMNSTNVSSDAEARSGDASVSNTVGIVRVGPTVNDPANCPPANGGLNACIAHDGDNVARVSQTALSDTGDAVAGSQVTGIVISGGGSADVELSNTSDGDEATSGDASSFNTIDEVIVGPTVGSELPFGDGEADDAGTGSSALPGAGGPVLAVLPGGVSSASIRADEINALIVQDGDNEADLAQNATAGTGDAVAGGQVTGIVVSQQGSVSVRNQQASEDAEAVSGDSDASNNLDLVVVGPQVVLPEEEEVILPPPSIESIRADGDINATIVQDGDNEANVTQTANAQTGDAVAGATITGVVTAGIITAGGDVVGGSVSVVTDNQSVDAEATTGNATAANDTELVFAGPIVIEPALAPLAPLSIRADNINAGIVQEGDNTSTVDQSAVSETGDAVAGGQVIGVVANGGDVSIEASNVSDGDEATSGDADSSNDLGQVLTGPFLETAPPAAIGIESIRADGDINAGIVQDGDNDSDVSQSAVAATGDAVAGTQVIGVVATGGSTSIVASNESEDSEALTGNADAANNTLLVDTGPRAGSDLALGSLSVNADNIDALIVQDGDNTTDLSQDAAATTGDAVAGGQVFGVVTTAGDVAIDASNLSDGDEAVSGDADAENLFGFAITGPIAVPGDEAMGVESIRTDGDVNALIVQDGDNETGVSQAAGAATGDAVAGAQVIGVVAGGDVSIVASNESEDSEATSGDADAENLTFLIITGPIGIGTVGGGAGVESIRTDGDLNALIAQDGDNETDVSQDAAATTGDAVAGGQVFGVVSTGGSVAIDASNLSDGDEAVSGDADAENLFGTAITGPIGAGDTGGGAGPESIRADGDVNALIVQDGDNETGVSQAAGAATGDAVAGAQVIGVVATGGSTSIVASNESEDSEATSGDADAENLTGGMITGPIANGTVGGGAGVESIRTDGDLNALIAQDGDNETDVSQDAAATTGDAVAGGQVFGVVTTGGSVAIDASNLSDGDEAVSGDADAENLFGIAITGPIGSGDTGGGAGPESIRADGDVNALIVQDGDNETGVSQAAGAATGDAVAGAQVIGVVAGGDVSIVASNESEDSEATSGDADAANLTGTIITGPIASGTVGGGAGVESIRTDGALNALIAQDGDNETDVSQDAAATTGDAVAGGQVFGVVTTGGSVAIDASNLSDGDEAVSGDADAENLFGIAITGPIGSGDTGGGAGPESIRADGDVNALIVQDGDNETGVSQAAGAATGDAVAGAQVIGVVATGGSTSIVASNESEDSEATSGDADAANLTDIVITGPIAFGTVGGGAGVESIRTDGALNALIAQDGDNETDVSQDAAATTGDAVAGGQVFGVVTTAGGDVSIDASNVSEDAEALTGDATAENVLGVAITGPIASGELDGGAGLESIRADSINALIVQDGDNSTDVSQSVSADTGDAVAGAQVIGVVASGAVSIVASNDSSDDLAESGDADGVNAIGAVLVGPIAGPAVIGLSIVADDIDAVIVHDGDNDASISQSLDVGSGDAVAGGQVIGVVSTGGSIDITQDQTSEDSESLTGDVTGDNTVFFVHVGPLPEGAFF